MGLFDRLTEYNIALKDGMITKCMEDYIDGFQVCHRLSTRSDLLYAPKMCMPSLTP